MRGRLARATGALLLALLTLRPAPMVTAAGSLEAFVREDGGRPVVDAVVSLMAAGRRWHPRGRDRR